MGDYTLEQLEAALAVAENNAPTQPFNASELIKQIGSGAIEGTAGTLGFLADLGDLISPVSMAEPNAPFTFDKTDKAIKLVEPITAQQRPEWYYRYPRRVAEFVTPGGAINKVGKATKYASAFPSLLRGAVVDTAAAVGSQAGQDMAPNSTLAPLLGAVLGGVTAETGINIGQTTRRQLAGLNRKEVEASAAYVLKEMGLKADKVDDLVKNMPDDELGKLMTSAEVTDDAGMAQLQEYLTGKTPGSKKLADLTSARNDAREAVISTLYGADAPPNMEGLGGRLRGGAETVSKQMAGEAQDAWAKFPRNKPVRTNRLRQTIISRAAEKQAGLPTDRRVQALMNQIVEADELPTGALQDIRSDALFLKRDANLTPRELDILDDIERGIDHVVKAAATQGEYNPRQVLDPNKALTPKDYATWKKGRDITRERAEIFGRSTVGGTLLNESVRPSDLVKRTFKGDAKAVTELKAALRNNPALIDEYKAAVTTLIKKNADGYITTAKLNDFISQNKNGLEALYGQGGVAKLERVLKDLRSADRVSKNANMASKGQSATAQKLRTAGEIKRLISSRGNSRIPAIGLMFDELVQGAKEASKEAIEDLLLEAALSPKTLAELIKSPTEARVRSVLGELGLLVQKGGVAGGRGAFLSGLTNDGPAQPTEGLRLPVEAQLSRPRELGPNQYQEIAPFSTGAENRRSVDHINLQDSYPNNRPNAGATQEQPAKTPVALRNFIGSLPPLVQAVIKVESNGNHKAESGAGAQGLMQLMPAMQKAFDVSDPFDPQQNVRGGMLLLQEELNRFDDLKLALAAYNAGSPKVRQAIQKAGGRKDFGAIKRFLPRETQNYVMKVIKEQNNLARA